MSGYWREVEIVKVWKNERKKRKVETVVNGVKNEGEVVRVKGRE